MRRYMTFLQRVARGDVEIGHVRDAQMPSDFMTKFVPKAKYEMSIEFATNARNAVARGLRGAKSTTHTAGHVHAVRA